jgi:glycosyltransferase involved in cell wall biosynthesis
MVQHLSSSVDFYIVTRDRDYQTDKPYEGLERDRWVQGTSGEHIKYIHEGSLNDDYMNSLLQERDYSHVYIHGIFSPIFSIRTQKFFRNRPEQLLLAPRGMLRQGALSIKGWKKKTYLRIAKLLGWYSTTVFHATDEHEAEDIITWFGNDVKIQIAPNLAKKSLEKPSIKHKEKGELNLVFLGRVAPEKNLKFAIDIIRSFDIGGVTLHIYGAVYDREYLKECEGVISRINNGNIVRFCGTRPPNEIQAILQSAHALFLPTRGENFGHVILESFMASRPVVISKETPWQGLEDQGSGYDIHLNDVQGFKRALTELMEMENSDYQALCAAAYSKYKDFSTDEEIVAASKGLFLTREG